MCVASVESKRRIAPPFREVVAMRLDCNRQLPADADLGLCLSLSQLVDEVVEIMRNDCRCNVQFLE